MDGSETDAEPVSEDSRLRWFARGMLVGVLVVGSSNALSFFFRSRGWGSLLGARDSSDEAIGFPLLVWEETGGYGSHPLNIWAFGFDVVCGLLLGAFFGLLAVSNRQHLNQMTSRFQANGNADQFRIQFSIRGLMICAAFAAFGSAVARTFAPRVEILAAIYAFGPVALVTIAFLPRRLRWQQRVAIITPMTFVLIAVAITLANALGIEFDKVLMGIFICWTPQTAFAAIGLSAFLLVREHQNLVRHQAQQ